jgi:cell division protein FtsB
MKKKYKSVDEMLEAIASKDLLLKYYRAKINKLEKEVEKLMNIGGKK